MISLKVILLVLSSFNDNASTKCQEIASPSRSSSVANHTVSAFFANDFNSPTSFFLSEGTLYSGLKSFSISTDIPLEESSLICPKLDLTTYSFPR